MLTTTWYIVLGLVYTGVDNDKRYGQRQDSGKDM
jgi:hypothetical protein